LGGLISDGKLLHRILEKILVAVLFHSFLLLLLFVIRRFIPTINLSIEYISITQAHNVDETHALDHIPMMRLQLGHAAMIL